MVQQGCIGPMCNMLSTEDPLVIQVILDGLGNILKMAGNQAKIIAKAIEEVGGMEKIEGLQTHENMEIYKLAYTLVEMYFQGDVSVVLRTLFVAIIIVKVVYRLCKCCIFLLLFNLCVLV